jgi:ankyrin repeat protein
MLPKGGKYGTAIQAATFSGNLDTVRLLLESGSDPNVQGASLAIPMM